MHVRKMRRIESRRRSWLHRLLWRDNGAVTVFSVLVLSTLLLFFGLLIDYARIAAMHKLTEDAARAGVRSVLSAYDAKLYERYGLFGRGGSDGSRLFADAVNANMSVEHYDAIPYMKLVNVRVDGAELYTAGVLGDHRIFARQLQEDMKYKAPIDFALELVAKLAPMAKSLKEATSTIDVLERMRELYERREEALAETLRMQRLAADAIRDSGLDEAVSYAGMLAQGYEEYIGQVMHDSALEEGEKPQYEKEIAAYRSKAAITAHRLQSASADTDSRHIRHMSAAEHNLKLAISLNEEMKAVMAEAKEQSEYDGFDTVAESGSADGGEDEIGAEAELDEIKRSAERLIRSVNWFEAYQLELREQEEGWLSLRYGADSFSGALSEAMGQTAFSQGFAQTLSGSAAQLEQRHARYLQLYISPANVIEARDAELQEGDVKAKLKEQEKESESKWKQAKAMLGGLSSLQGEDEAKRQFEEAKQRYERNKRFNAFLEDGGNANPESGRGESGDAYDAAGQSSAAMKGIFAGMAGMLEQARDDWYYGEYVLHRFDYFPPQQLKSMLEGGSLDELSAALSFNNQEAEYVLYGFHNPVGNVAAAYGELFTVRLAIRTMEGLIESRSLGHPLLVLSAALIYGLEKTMEDMLSFANRGAAPLSKYMKADISYKDYLRLFMLMHGGNERTRLSRIAAVIEQDRNITLSEVPAAVTGEAKASIKLWFIPGLLKLLGKAGVLQGKVVDGRYETSETMGLSY